MSNDLRKFHERFPNPKLSTSRTSRMKPWRNSEFPVSMHSPRTPTLILGPSDDDHPISIDYREKVESLSPLPLFSPSVSFLFRFSFFFYLLTYFDIQTLGPRCATCRNLSESVSTPKQFISVTVQVQFILIELNLSYSLTPEILVKISFLGLLNNPPPKEIMKIRLSGNSTKSYWVTRFCKTNPTVKSVSSSEI